MSTTTTTEGVIAQHSGYRARVLTDGFVIEQAVGEDWHEVDGMTTWAGPEWVRTVALDVLEDYVPEILATCDQCEWAEIILDEHTRWDAQARHYVAEHGWRMHDWFRGQGICRRHGCNTMGTGDWYNDESCKGR